jgi:hypothetical protein
LAIRRRPFGRGRQIAGIRFCGALTALGLLALVATVGCNKEPESGLLNSASRDNSVESSDRQPALTGSAPPNRQPHNAEPAAAGSGNILLTDITADTGIDFRHTDGSSGRRYIVETVTAGLALFDYDLDGDIDIYFVNGAPLMGTQVDEPPTNALYRNDGGMRFTDVTRESGTGDVGYGLGVAIGDYDRDGFPDIYVNNFGPNVMYRNNGDGTFRDTTAETGTAGEANKVGAGACFLDADGDGDLDLYVSNYIEFECGDEEPYYLKGFHVYRGPFHYTPTPDVFYLNNGDGSFRDASDERGISAVSGRGMGTVCFDYEQDGDTDIFVANDSSANFLFQNDGRGFFAEVGLLAGVALDYKGETQGSMGVACGDINNDLLLDFHLTSYQDEFPALYQNRGGGLFDDVALTANAGRGSLPHVKWGNGFADFDNDGDRDIFIACGHLYDNVDEFSGTTDYKVKNMLMENLGSGKFVDVSNACGDGLEPIYSSRGAAFADLDNDGDIDAVIVNSRDPPTIIRNDSPVKNHWLQIQLKGVATNLEGIGASVTVTAGDLKQLDEVHSGCGYQSHFGTRLHFGLGNHDQIDRLEVRWIGNPTPDVLVNIPADQLISLVEGDHADTK